MAEQKVETMAATRVEQKAEMTVGQTVAQKAR